MSFAGIAVGVGLVATAGVAAYSASSQSGIANSQLGIAQDQQYKQDTSFQQLQTLINNPDSFFSSNIYQAAANQGSQAVARQGAAQFGPNSGNTAQALQAYGQTFGQQQLLGQEQLLAGMSGVGFNPSTAASGASSATGSATAAGNQLAGTIGFLGTSGMLSSGSSAGIGDSTYLNNAQDAINSSDWWTSLSGG